MSQSQEAEKAAREIMEHYSRMLVLGATIEQLNHFIAQALLSFSEAAIEAERQRACAFLTKCCWGDKDILAFLEFGTDK